MPPFRSTKLEFASVLSYVPREGGGDLGDQSRDVMRILKDGRMIGSPPAPLSDLVARLIKGGGARVNGQSLSDDAAILNLQDLGASGHIKLSAGRKKHALIQPA